MDIATVWPGHKVLGVIATRSPETLTRALLGCGVAAGPTFVTTFMVEGARRDSYSSVRHPISSLALGPRGWVQALSFASTGALYLAAALGLKRSGTEGDLDAVLVGAAATGMLGVATFVSDPADTYPPGPLTRTGHTPRGAVHDVFTAATLAGLPTAVLVYSRAMLHDGHKPWALYSAGSALAMLVSFAMCSAGSRGRARFTPYEGLLERACVVAGVGWLSSSCLRALRSMRR